MARDNPSNPYTRDPGHTQKDIPLPVQKAKVMAAGDHPEDDAFHTVRIRVYGDQATYIAPVITPMFGSVWVPKEGEDVAVIFGNSDKPWVIGAWYPLDRVEDGNVDLPEYEAGDMRVGNESGSHVTVHNDGHITVQTPGTEKIDIDTQSAATYLDTDQSVPGDSNYYIVEFDMEEYDQQDLFDTTTHEYTLLHNGRYELNATVEIPSPGQNNLYTLAIFRNDTLEKRKSRQSVVNEPLSVDVELNRRMDEGDVLDCRLLQDSGSAKTIGGNRVSNNFDLQREGI
jgi:uncharacterized protein involved in type VI secretion and phage assembly